jgi:lauroyl/myristoyl acyltransferase
MERSLQPSKLYALLKPFISVRVILNTFFKKNRTCVPLPDFLVAAGTARTGRRQRRNSYLNEYIRYFPERLAEAKWMDRCRITGLERLRLARQNGRPVVLAFSHFGPFFLLRLWLRSAGIPTASLMGGKLEHRSRLRQLSDRVVPFPEVPSVFYLDRLREMANFLASGSPLLIAIDGEAGKQMELPFCEGWTFRMATGAMRLASRHQAELIPCSIMDEGCWRFRIALGRPVPREFLTAESDWALAGKHLLEEMIPHFQAHPEQCARTLIGCLRKNSATSPK